MHEKIKFIHTADLHLDSPFKGLTHISDELFKSLKESTFIAFENIVHYAIEKSVDFILISGDLFEHEKQSLKAQLFLEKQFLRLQENKIDVFLSYGNHDYIKGNDLMINYPPNVHIFDDERVTYKPFIKDGKTLAHIYGFSYVNKEVYERKIEEFHTVNKKEVPYHIGMLHGMLQGVEGHDPYAPFTKTDLKSNDLDYWALGHIHRRQIISEDPLTIYPGNIQGRHRHESGERGCYYVEMDYRQAPTYQFLPTAQYIFENVIFKIEKNAKFNQVRHQLEELLKQTEAHLIYLMIEFPNYETVGYYKNYVEQWIDLYNEQEKMQYIYKWTVQIKEKALQIDNPFLQEVKQVLNEEDWIKNEVNLLRNHSRIKKYINEKDLNHLEEKADELIMQMMSGKEVD